MWRRDVQARRQWLRRCGQLADFAANAEERAKLHGEICRRAASKAKCERHTAYDEFFDARQQRGLGLVAPRFDELPFLAWDLFSGAFQSIARALRTTIRGSLVRTLARSRQGLVGCRGVPLFVPAVSALIAGRRGLLAVEQVQTLDWQGLFKAGLQVDFLLFAPLLYIHQTYGGLSVGVVALLGRAPSRAWVCVEVTRALCPLAHRHAHVSACRHTSHFIAFWRAAGRFPDHIHASPECRFAALPESLWFHA